jgi:Na+/H+-dicarboxylate symporter
MSLYTNSFTPTINEIVELGDAVYGFTRLFVMGIVFFGLVIGVRRPRTKSKVRGRVTNASSL